MGNPFRDDQQPLSEINITPFVDVLLVLLVIFMITAPIVQHHIAIDLPEDSYSENQAIVEKNISVLIDSSNLLYLDHEKIGRVSDPLIQTEFQKRIQQKIKSQKLKLSFDLEADQSIPYGSVVPIIARLKEMDVGLNLVIRQPN